MSSDNSLNHISTSTDVPITVDKIVPFDELVHRPCYVKPISQKRLEQLALDKYHSCGRGITFSDVQEEFSCSKKKSQSKLKRCCMRSMDRKGKVHQPILFRAHKRTIPQQYFPACRRANIIEDLKNRKSVLVQPTGVNLSKLSKYPLFNAIEHQKASSFLEALAILPFAPPSIHRLQLMFHLDREYYHELEQKEHQINRAKSHEEFIGRRHVTYALSPNGTVEVYIATTDTPLRIEEDEDVSDIFAFLGQVRDRFLYHVSDIRERKVPPLLNWILKQCDFNKDIEIDDKAQFTLPDIQLKSADRVFRMYVKIIKDKAYCRVEESLALNQALSEALDNIRHPYKSIESKIDKLTELMERKTQQPVIEERETKHD